MKGFKPCPFCGGEDLCLSKRDFFDEQVEKTDSFCVSITCERCSVEMYYHNARDYDLALEYLRGKWNRREQGNERKTE